MVDFLCLPDLRQRCADLRITDAVVAADEDERGETETVEHAPARVGHKTIQIYVVTKAARAATFKRRPSHRHHTLGMLTDLANLRSFTIEMPSPERDDERLRVARARSGDLAAFEELYHGHTARVFALCLRLTGDRVQATELTQDVFVQAWERLSSFRGEAAFTSWLHRIAVNTLLMRVRADKRRVARVQLAEDAVPDASPTAAEAAAAGGSIPPVDIEQVIDLERAIAALPPGARQVFVLHDVVGYRHEEIAEMTGLAAGTLRAQLHRARRLLMEALER